MPSLWKKVLKLWRMEPLYAVVCKKKNVHAIDEENESSESEIEAMYPVNAVSSKKNIIYAELEICDKPVKIQVDCGASVNVLPKNLTGDIQVRPTTTLLQMWNKSVVKPIGEAKVPVCNPVTGQRFRCKFIVVPDECDFIPLLGSKASQKMNLITINKHQFKQVAAISTPCDPLKNYAEVFNNDLGRLPGKVKLNVDDSITPQVAPIHRVPESLKEKLKSELHNLCEQEVITPVHEPTDWVSNIVIATKKSGELRICINPQGLNKALKRERYQLPILEDFLPNLAQAKVFSTLDLKAGYWHVELDEQSSFLTTFSTPYGRYRFLRLPFGCNVSSEIFQRKLTEAIGDLPGILCVADDIMIYGTGASETEAIDDHDIKLHALLQRCQELGIRLNKEKMKIRKKSVKFLGHLITADGLKPDPTKCQAIDEMPAPEDRKGVQRLNGFVNYLAKFMPKLSDVMEPIRQLTRKEIPWNWGPSQSQAFESIKKLVKEAPCLKYFDSSKPLSIQCDASEKGIGTALLQNGSPICYASRAMTEVETRYAQIEKELLAIVYSLEKFHQYTFARHVTVSTDHKPLESILKKSLFKAPRRLQGMLMRMQRYHFTVVYKPGKEMFLADTLSRAFMLTNTDKNPQEEFEQINMVRYLPITNDRLSTIRENTRCDDALQLLKEVILKGWPGDKTCLPSQVHPYFPYRDELTAQDGLLFRGERVIIPTSLRQVMKERIHSSHIGIEGCLRRARECLYWPNMNADIKDYIQRCQICSEFQNANQKETLMPHHVPDRPWSKVGIDLFSVQDVNYVITVDYTSNFWEVDRIENTESRTVIRKIKAHFARYGIPDQVISDNGPQFSSSSFSHFSRDWDFEHLTISPHHSQANGQVESAVKTAKRLLKKAQKAKSDIYLAVLDHRNTPTQGMQASPAQILMNRRTKTLLPTTASLLKPATTYNAELKHMSKEKQKSYFDRHAKDLEPLDEGQCVRMKPFQKGRDEWKSAVITKRLDERSYELEMDNRTFRRNRVDIKPVKQSEPLKTSEANENNTLAKPIEPLTVATPDKRFKNNTASDDVQTTRTDESPRTSVTKKREDQTISNKFQPGTSQKQKNPTERNTQTQPDTSRNKLQSGTSQKQMDPTERKTQPQHPQPGTPPKVIATRSGRIVKRPVRFQ